MWSVVTKKWSPLLDKVPKMEQDEPLYCCCAKEQEKHKTKDYRFRKNGRRALDHRIRKGHRMPELTPAIHSHNIQTA